MPRPSVKRIEIEQSGQPIDGKVAGYRPEIIREGAQRRPGGPWVYVLEMLAYAHNAAAEGRSAKAAFYIDLAAFATRELLREKPHAATQDLHRAGTPFPRRALR